MWMTKPQIDRLCVAQWHVCVHVYELGADASHVPISIYVYKHHRLLHIRTAQPVCTIALRDRDGAFVAMELDLTDNLQHTGCLNLLHIRNL